MDKLKMQTLDGVQNNIDKIAALFPSCITEKIDKQGRLVHSIDFDKLRQELSSEIVEGREERYQFTWPDKKKAILLANSPINATLRPCREESVDFDNTQNLYIEGDNLDVLKCLKETYLGKVKMIYIDPPYNTGNDFVYEDNFAESTAEYLANSGQYDEQGNRLVNNTESNGRFHTDWLNMIYPRIKVAKELLSDSGVIVVSIGDRELRNMLFVLDEIFGTTNQVCIFVWKSRAKPTNAGNAKYRPQKVAEYILVYSKKSPDTMLFNVIASKIRNYPHEDKNGQYRITTILTSNRGTFRRETMRFESHGFMPDEDFRWKAGKTSIDNLYDTNHMYITEDGIPMEKKYSHEESDPLYPIYTYIDQDLSGTAENGKAELSSLIGNKHGFDTVKPVQLMKYLIQTFTNDSDLLIDLFAGSSTLAQTCFEQNAEESSKRYIISIQIAELCDPEGEACKAGFSTICEIGKERIRRAGKKIKEELAVKQQENGLFTKQEEKQTLDIGFRVLKLDSSNMEDIYYSPAEYNQQTLFTKTESVKSDRTSEDLLFQVMLELGATLDSKIERTEIEGKTIYNVASNYLVACFDNEINDSIVTAIAKMQPQYAVFRDSSMADDSTATNFEQIFKTYSPNTTTKVL